MQATSKKTVTNITLELSLREAEILRALMGNVPTSCFMETANGSYRVLNQQINPITENEVVKFTDSCIKEIDKEIFN